MRVFIFLLLLFATFPLSGCYSQNETAVTTKDQEADAYSWDFGKVKEGEIVEHVFTLENKSDKVLVITNVHTSCGCTESQVKSKSILPGMSSEVVVRFDTKGYARGRVVQQHVYLDTNNPDTPVLKFKIQAEIEK